ncbi:MAG: hypothetical protein ABIF71_08410 [Planctomycetota bacterium]
MGAELSADAGQWDACATGFALLCYLGYGHTQRAGHFRTQVANGLAWLEEAQAEDGSFSPNNYVHAVATMAVVEAHAMCPDSRLEAMGRRAVAVILARQNPYLGWDYGAPSTRNDTSVTGWQIMALKSAKAAGFDIGTAFDGALAHLDRVTPALISGEGARLAEDCAYTYYTDKDDPGHRNSTMTAISMLCRIFMGARVASPLLAGHTRMVAEHMPAAYDGAGLYEWYYATLAMHQVGGRNWAAWGAAITRVLEGVQCGKGCARGSWDPTTDFACQKAGRLFATVMGCLSMEVPFRYARMGAMQRI